MKKQDSFPTTAAGLRTGAAYIRVSTDDQLEYSPESQLQEIRLFCEKNNILLDSNHIYIEEEGCSGRKSQNRSAFQAMIAAAKTHPKPFEVIVLWKFSRFARNQDESTFYKSMLRKKLGIDVISVSEPLMEGMYGRLIEMIIEWQDEFYSVNLSAEVRRSMKYKAEKGYYNGKMPLGYHKEPNALPVIIESEAHIVRTIFQMYITGYDKNYITRFLNNSGFKTKTGKIFDSDSVSYILSNPFYIGKIRWNRRNSSSTSKLKDESEWIIADGHHEPLIDLDVWETAQEKSAQILRTHQAYAHPVSHTKHWLAGVVKCPICGKSLSYKSGYIRKEKNVRTGEGFQCLGYRRGLHGESQFISEKKLSAAMITSLEQMLSLQDSPSFELIRKQHTDNELQLQIYQHELDGLIRKEERIRSAYLNEIDTLEEYKRNRTLISKRREELNSLIASIQADSMVSPENYREEFLSKVRDVLEVLKNPDAPYELKGEAIRNVVRRAILHRETQTLEVFYYLLI